MVNGRKRRRKSTKQVGKFIRKGKVNYDRDFGYICRTPGVCPDVMCVQLKFTQNIETSGASPLVEIYRGNGPYDPDTGTGASTARGFGEWAALYRRYRVIGSKVKFAVLPAAGAAVGSAITALTDSTGLPTGQQYQQQRYNKYQMVGNDDIARLEPLTMYMSTARIRGEPKDVVHYNPELSALTTTNPNFQWFWHVCAYDPDGLTTTISFNAILEIEYDVEFYDRRTL